MQYVRRLLPFLFTVCLFAVGFYAVSNTHDIIDWWRLRDYTPSDTVTRLAQQSGMNDAGTKLFYVHDPELLTKETFRDKCTVGEETIVLGCYITNQRIYLYNVEDDRLNGIEEVTAAHEMLHAAYDRLSPKEKSDLQVMIEDAYSRVTDTRLRENVRSYEARDPSVVINELHSILGTEVRDLPKDLEKYYSKYFSDRMKVVTYAESYASSFSELEEKIKAYDAQLSELNGEITRRQAELQELGASIEADRNRISSLKGDVSAYNQAVISFNMRVSNYNTAADEVKRIIEQYNAIIVERNAIAVEERDLVNSIDTRESELQ
ncbi:MAG TPA: hypothetical protein PKD20_00085 [Candidatus Saccharibacteria bacterium]|jgi:hypothetical protein|nr:hypothetical protein [Candidatus Saccharibacteria bacterium]HMT55254.1 hypothetical protein [Candidatus Saccharibacteria bacterium]